MSDNLVQELEKSSTLGTRIGAERIKQIRRNRRISDDGLTVADCVPFFFCPRPVMLKSIHLRYRTSPFRGGQDPIIHLQFNLEQVIRWAFDNDKRIFVSNRNAATYRGWIVEDIRAIADLNWRAINSTHWNPYDTVYTYKQAEFLIQHAIPCSLISRIGTINSILRARVQLIVNNSTFNPAISIEKEWYF